MRFLHTSDWHLGCGLFGRKRYDEQESFLLWLTDLIRAEAVRLVLVSGDVFDSSMPSNRAQELYYSFLNRLRESDCRHLVIIAGNHDSPSLLNAPAPLLKHFRIHVLGQRSTNPEDELLVLRDEKDEAELLVCAVPYLRERDLRRVESEESIDIKERKLLDGIREHYRELSELAFELGSTLPQAPPVLAMGHLYAQGGELREGDAVRELYLGSAIRVGADVFDSRLAYVALGHLHRAQKVAGKDQVRYSGSPVPLSFQEAEYEHVVLIGDLDRIAETRTIPVPQMRLLRTLSGDETAILEGLEPLLETGQSCWLDVDYQGESSSTWLRQEISSRLEGSAVELLRFQNRQITARLTSSEALKVSLDDLEPQELFQRCLERHDIQGDQAEELTQRYLSVLQAIRERDPNAV